MILIILFLGLILRLILASHGTYWGDMNSWIGWSNRLLDVGFKDFYLTWCDYLPGYLYILWFLGNLKNVFLSLKINIPNEVFYKMPSILADLGISYLIFKIVKEFKNKKTALISSAIYLFNPAIWVNSSLWGQADGFLAFFLFLAFYLFAKKNIFVSAIFFGLSCIIKPLSFFVLPFISFYLLIKKKIKTFFTFLLTSLMIIILSFIPFSEGNYFNFVFDRFKIVFEQYPYTSLNAFNFWGVLSLLWEADNLKFLQLSYQNWGMIIFALFYLLISIIMIKNLVSKKLTRKKETYFLFAFAGLILFNTYLFSTRMHERHLLPAFSFLNLAAVFNPFIWITYFIASLIYILNLRYAFVWLTYDFKLIFSPLVVQLFSLLQLIIFIFLFFVLEKRPPLFKNKPTLKSIRSRLLKNRFLKKKR